MVFFPILPTLFSLALYALPTYAAGVGVSLKHAFDVHVTLGEPTGPVSIPNGEVIVEPITGGVIKGPLFNGNISSGSVVATFTSNMTVENPFVQIFGKADDGSPFVATGQGVGVAGAQVARVIVEIGGKYSALAHEFILATFTDNKVTPPTKSTIEGWIVSRDD